MRQLKKNKQKLYYSQPKYFNLTDDNGIIFITENEEEIIYDYGNLPAPIEKIFAADESGNIIYTDVDGVQVPHP